MKTCPACGFDLWQYNQSTLTCKHGHRFDRELKPVPAQPVYVAKPQPAPQPFVRVIERRQPLAVAAACGALAAVLVDVGWALIT